MAVLESSHLITVGFGPFPESLLEHPLKAAVDDQRLPSQVFQLDRLLAGKALSRVTAVIRSSLTSIAARLTRL